LDPCCAGSTLICELLQARVTEVGLEGYERT